MIKKLSYAEAVEKANCKSFRRQAELEKQYECALKDWSKIAKHLPNPASAERDIGRAYKFSLGFFRFVARLKPEVWQIFWKEKRNEIEKGFQDFDKVTSTRCLPTGMKSNIFTDALTGAYVKLFVPKETLDCYLQSDRFLHEWRTVNTIDLKDRTPLLSKTQHAGILDIQKEYFSRGDNPFCRLWNEYSDGKKKARIPYDRLVERMLDYASRANKQWQPPFEQYSISALRKLYEKDSKVTSR